MGSKPAPPPDYTKDKAAYASTMSADRQQQAAAYNTQVADYNSSLAQLLSEAQSLNTTAKSRGLIDDEYFAPTRQQADALSARLNALQAPTALSFGSTAESPYGPVSISNPTLSSINTGMSAQIQGLLQGTNSTIDDLTSRRKAEEKRITEALNQGRAGLSGFQAQLSDADIGNKAGLDALRSQYQDMQNKANTFSSDILSEFGNDDFTSFKNQLSSANTGLQDLYSQRQTALNNVSQYEQGLNSLYDNLNSSVSGLGIGDVGLMDSYEKQLRDKITEANRFSAPVEYDFSQELPGLQQLLGQISTKRGERQAELDRIQSVQTRESNDAFNLLSNLGSSDYYNGANLAQLEQELAKNRRDINGFSSVLDYDFGDASGQLSQAEAMLEQLRSQRQTNLGSFTSRGDALMDQLNAYDLSNESGIRSSLNSAQAMAAELGRYTGNDLDPYRQKINSVVEMGNKRMSDLSAERQAIEASARNLLNTSRSNSYTNFSQLDSLAAELAAISDRQSSFNATQATDEIDALNALISGERGRIQGDLDAAEKARLAEQQALLQGWGPQGVSMGYTGAAAPWMTDLQRRTAQQAALPSSFARQLQVLYA